jgi:hypothetical protein
LFEAIITYMCDVSKPQVIIKKRIGLCITAAVICTSCHFKSKAVELYETVKKSCGPSTGMLNEALVLPVLKSKVGISDVPLVLSCMNIKVPDSRGLQRKLNNLSDKMVDINEGQKEKRSAVCAPHQSHCGEA